MRKNEKTKNENLKLKRKSHLETTFPEGDGEGEEKMTLEGV